MKIVKKNIDYLIQNLIQYRNDYLLKNNKNPLDETPFQEFFIQCLGETHNTQIRFLKLWIEEIQSILRR